MTPQHMVKGKGKKFIVSDDNIKTAAVAVVLGVVVIVLLLFLPKAKEIFVPKKVLPAHRALKAPSVGRSNRRVSLPAASVGPATVGTMPVGHGKIAIIIDDWGQSVSNCKYLKEIPEPLAVSILPGLRHTKDVAKCAGLYNKTTMLHLPLEAMYNNDFYPPNYIIKTTMPAALVEKILDEDLAQLPSIAGVNNHMGSKATADKTLMKIIFQRLKKKGLFFVDSMTAANSICEGLADQMDLAFGKRDVFLDNTITREAITKQFIVLAQRASRKGHAVAIGHAFNNLTMQIIKEEIPLLRKHGFEIVSIEELLKNK